jgi:hypothetical protein
MSNSIFQYKQIHQSHDKKNIEESKQILPISMSEAMDLWLPCSFGNEQEDDTNEQ